MKITFYGAVEEVTGSKYLLEHDDAKILIDCGLFQGSKELTRHNWDTFPISPNAIDAIVLTHAHIDHTGYIPALVKNGFKGPIYCSPATYEMCSFLLIDSANLQEEAAKFSHSRVPLYTKDDAQHALTLFKPVDYDIVTSVKSLHITLIRSGHILGSAFVIVNDGKQTLTFSGDLGRPNQPILKAPPTLKETDYLVLESTYGNRIHGNDDPKQTLSTEINETIRKGGTVLIPCFSVMRAQTMLYYLYELKQKKLIPDIPIFLDSPSAINITHLFCKFTNEYTFSPTVCTTALGVATYTPTMKESKQINDMSGSSIIISGSGMAEGGRMPFHLQRFISGSKNTILFVGYQAKGTDGRLLVDGAREIRIYDKEYPVHATIKNIQSLSAHADAQEIIEWLKHFEKGPKKVFLVHGEPESLQALKNRIEDRFKWQVIIPTYSESFDLV